MKAQLVVLVLVGCAAPAVFADLAKKKDKHHHHVPSTSTSTSATTPSSAGDFDFTEVAGDIPYIGEIDIIKIHLPLPAVPHNDSSTSDAATDGTGGTGGRGSSDGGLIVRPGADGHGRPPLYPQPAATEVPHVPQLPEVPDATEVPEAPEAPKQPEAPQQPEVPEVPEVPVPETPKTPESPEAPVSPPSPGPPEPPTPSPKEDDVVIPDVATFDAVFTNRSRLADRIRVFAFGGVFEVVVNRTRNSVEVVMIRDLSQNSTQDQEGDLPATLSAASTEQRPLLAMRAPSVTERQHSRAAEDGNDWAKNGENEDGEESLNGNSDEDQKEYGRRGDAYDPARNVTAAVFINGTELIGVHLGVVTFNTSGLFKLNVSMADGFMTVVVSRIRELVRREQEKSDQAAVLVPPMEELMKGKWDVKSADVQRSFVSAKRSGGANQTKGAPSDGGGLSAGTTLLAVIAVGALATLGAAFLVSRARARARVSSFVRRGEDYYGSVEYGEDAIYFSRSFA